jgi:membrane protease YdiL (CAAX protease family)
MTQRFIGLREALVSSERHEPQRRSPWQTVAVVVTMALGAACLAWSLHAPPGDWRFSAGTLLTAVVWVAGAVVVGPGPIRGAGWGTAAALAVGIGLVLVGVFVVAALVVARLPVLADPVQQLLRHADGTSLSLVAVLTLVNGLAEELFFRGALYQSLTGRRPVAVTTLLYAAVTVASGVPLLVVAAVILSVVVGVLRRLTGALVAPMAAHVTWSLGMLFLLPLVLPTSG